MQTQLRTRRIHPSRNISFPVGTILTVQEYYSKLWFNTVFGRYKKKGRDLNSLVQALVSYKLTENFSITKGCDWINRDEVLEIFNLEEFEQRTLFRVLEILGKNHEQIMADIQDRLFEQYDFEHTDINMDWTSLVLFGDKAKLGKYGYSRNHRPDKKQITLGIAEISDPVNVPIGMTVKPGNVNDVRHFRSTFKQVRRKPRPGSLNTFDKGAHSMDNVKLILVHKMKYLTAKKLNTSDDILIQKFDTVEAEMIDSEDGIYGIKYVKPSRNDYFYFSEKLKREQLEARWRKALRKLGEAKEIEASVQKGKLPKKYTINNPLVDVSYSYQTRLDQLSEAEALKLLNMTVRTGREGYFCLVSSEDLTLEEALTIYRKKDSIEKIFHSLKNEIDIKPLRVWSNNSIYGALIIGFLAQLFISLLRYDHPEVKHTATKFIRHSLRNLTVTVEFRPGRRKRHIYANFDPVNRAILARIRPFT